MHKYVADVCINQLTKVDKLLDRQRRWIELRVEIQHLLDVGEPDRIEAHLDGRCYMLAVTMECRVGMFC